MGYGSLLEKGDGGEGGSSVGIVENVCACVCRLVIQILSPAAG